MFSVGSIAGEGVKQFVETGDSDKLDREAANNNFLDAFIAPSIASGGGNTSTTIFVDGNNTKVIQELKIGMDCQIIFAGIHVDKISPFS
mgnify:CR=1 FL=1